MQPVVASELARKTLSQAVSRGADLAELYVEDRQTTRLNLEDCKVEEAVRGVDRGAGVRVFYGGLAAYAHTDDLSEASLVNAAREAASAARRSNKSQVLDFSRAESTLEFPVELPFDSVQAADKGELLRVLDREARRYDPRVTQVQAAYGEETRHLWIWNSDGRFAEDERNLIQLSVAVLAQEGDLVQRGVGVVGGQMGLELLKREDPLLEAREAAKSAVVMLGARAAPAGEMPVVMNHGWGGILFHEASGHALEGDFVNQGVSVFANKLGQRVASPLITLVDDATIPGRRGSFRFDDEGTESQRTILVERGVLEGYLWDLAQARRASTSSTGNGRRQSYRHMPMPRMTNTFIEAGESDPEEIVRSVKRGLFVKMLGGGQADPAKGDFVFSVSEGYLIEDGRLTAPVRGATLIGNGPEVLRQISMVGRDLRLDKGLGTCGKGQRVPVSVGQPTLLIPRIVVGGTDESF